MTEKQYVDVSCLAGLRAAVAVLHGVVGPTVAIRAKIKRCEKALYSLTEELHRRVEAAESEPSK